MLRTMLDRTYRTREGVKRLTCPHPDYKKAWIEIPGEWTLLHQANYQEAYSAVEETQGQWIAELSGALALVENFSIPGLKEDLSNLNEVPTTILAWLRDAVITDYLLSWEFDPKAREVSLNTSKTPKKRKRRRGSKPAGNTESKELS